MLFAIWSGNRATDDDSSSAHSREVVGVQNVETSRQSSVISPVPASPMVHDTETHDLEKELKIAVDIAATPYDEDKRPFVFKSTFWEVLCVMSLVSAQLTNVCKTIAVC